MTGKKALVFLADGTEEMEFTIVYDVLGESSPRSPFTLF